MGILTALRKLLKSHDELKRDAADTQNEFQKRWQIYLNSLPKKGHLIESLREGPQFEEQIETLKQSLAYELVDIAEEEKSDEELIADLERISPEEDDPLSPFQKAEQLLKQLFDLHTNEFYTLTTLTQKYLDQPRSKMIHHLQRVWHAEQVLVDRIHRLEEEQGQLIHQLINVSPIKKS